MSAIAGPVTRGSAFARVLRDHRLRGLSAAFFWFCGAEYGAWVAVLVYAFTRDVLTVTLSIDVLGLGQSGAGYLEAAYGMGCVIGGAANVLLLGVRRLALWAVAGSACAGAALVVTVVSLYALEREPFLTALTGSPQARTAAESLATERLSHG